VHGISLTPAAGKGCAPPPSPPPPSQALFALLIVGYAIYMDHPGVLHGMIEHPPPPYPTG
jgi:MYXO-CTERM domain-containing protein